MNINITVTIEPDDKLDTMTDDEIIGWLYDDFPNMLDLTNWEIVRAAGAPAALDETKGAK